MGSAYRSWAVLLCALAITGLLTATSLVVQGAEGSLQQALDRLGADIIVVSKGAESRIENALIMGTPARAWMPEDNLARIAALPGVATVSPQLYLSSLYGASCCSASEMLLVAYDPATDFTLRPWLEHELEGALGPGEAIGGSSVFVPDGEQYIRLYGSPITLRGNLAPTGTNLDHTLFFTFETAQQIAAHSWELAEQPLEIPPRSISAALIKVQPGSDPQRVALEILQAVPGVTPIERPELFHTFQEQISGLLHSLLAILAGTGACSLVLLGLVFSLAAHERRRQVGVLRALGATPGTVLRLLLGEAAALALSGGALGAMLGSFSVCLFQSWIASSLHIPFLFPGLLSWLAMVARILALTVAGVMSAALLPSLRSSYLWTLHWRCGNECDD